jgi:hypothetical protein
LVAEREGFEPSVGGCPTPDFESSMQHLHYAGTRMDIGSMVMHTVQ